MSAGPAPKDYAPDDLMGFIDYFLVEYAKHHRTGSIKRITGILKHFRRFLMTTPNAPKLVSEVAERHIKEWFAWRREQTDPRLKIPLKPHVVVGETEQLSGLFKLSVDEGKLKYNIAKTELDKIRAAYPKPKPEDQRKYLAPEERRDFLKAIDDAVVAGTVPLDYADLAKVMLSTGLRVQAALNLDYAWIGKGWIVKVPAEQDKCKTGYSTVVADLGQSVLTRRRLMQLSGRVFPDGMTQAVSYYYLRRLGITNHMLRHSFATALVDEKVPIQVISELLGHKSISTTQIYAKIRDTQKMDAVGKLKFG